MNQENIEPNITLNYAWTEFLCFHGSFFSLNTSFSYLVMKFWNKDFVYIIMIGWIREPLWSVPSHIPPRVNHTQKQQESRSHQHVTGRLLTNIGFTPDIALSPWDPSKTPLGLYPELSVFCLHQLSSNIQIQVPILGESWCKLHGFYPIVRSKKKSVWGNKNLCLICLQYSFVCFCSDF